EDFALYVDGDLAGEVATRDRGGHFGNVADLRRKVATHRVDGVGKVLPRPRHPGDHRLDAKPPLGADFACHAGYLRGNGAKLFHDRVDGFLELQNLPAHIDSDLFGEIAIGDGNGHFSDISDLAREV